jgi:hypothetical protein
VLVERPPGIGKTLLSRAAVDDAGVVGAETLFARAESLERSYAYGVVRQLLEPALSGITPVKSREVV